MTKRRAFTPLIATAAALALAAPALADNVSVTLTGSGGTRQFSVEDMSGNPLTALDLTSSSQPFKVHVQDNAFLPSAGQGNYSVSATMSNLYLKTGASTYNYAVKVPSSDLSVGFGSNPLSATGLSLVDLPTLNLTGTLTCSNPLDLQPLATQLGLGLVSGLLSGVLTQLTNLCTAITTAGSGAVSAAVNGAQQTVSPVLSSLTDLPTALGGATGGTFTNPSFAAGTVGEGDTAGATGAPSATSVSLMQGTQGLTSGLATAIKNALNGASALVAGSGTALTTTQAVTTGLTTAGTTVDNALAQLLQTLSSSQAVSAINSALSLASFATPVLSDIRAVTGSYYSVPVLQASARTPVAGTYGGTMTVTFVQS